MERKINPLPFEHSISVGVPFSSLSVFALTVTSFHMGRSVNRQRIKMLLEKMRHHLRLCVWFARAGDTLTETLTETRRLPPEAHAAAALMQARGIYSAALVKSQENNLSMENCCIGSVICWENFAFKVWRRSLMKICTENSGFGNFSCHFQLWFAVFCSRLSAIFSIL